MVYRNVRSDEDCAALQRDLTQLEQWEDSWCMSFNAEKCSTIAISRKRNKLTHPYTLHNHVLERVDSATYLGVELSSDLTWAKTINKMTAKANKQLGFMKRNIPIKNSKIKDVAYKGLVRPILEYCAPIWDPHHKKYINQIEMVQRRAARFVLGQYQKTCSVTEMLRRLQWESLERRRKQACLVMFFKIQYELVAVQMPHFVSRPERPRPGYPHQYQIPFCSTEAYRQSFFPKSIRLWNALPVTIACQSSLPPFKAALSSLSL